MDTKKLTKIFIILGAFFACAVGLIIFLVYYSGRSNTQTVDPNANTNTTIQATPISFDSYTISIDQESGLGSTKYTTTLTDPITNDVLQVSDDVDFGIVSFNTPGDLMWFSCPDAYKLVGPISKTGDIVEVRDEAANIELLDTNNHNLTVTCTKLDTETGADKIR